jgi:Leu/Phe-tRNA-protein transferase
MKKMNQERMNLYIDSDLSQAIAKNAKKDYLRKTTWVTQFLRKSLLKNNSMSNQKNDES